MKNIKYVGTSDYREISAADFEALEVEPSKEEANGLRFAKGEIIEITDKVAEVLIDDISFVGEFAELTDDDIKAEKEAAKEAQREQVEARRAALLSSSGTPSPTASDSEADPNAVGGGTVGTTGARRGSVTAGSSTAGAGS